MAGEHGRVKLRDSAAAWRQVDDEIILLDLDRSTYVSINRSGAVLWPMLVEGTTRDDLVVTLVDSFGIERERALVDVDSFLDACRSRAWLDE